MSLGDVVNQFHDQDSLADTSASEETNLTSLGVGGKEIDNLIPVTRISCSTLMSSNSGASAWIACLLSVAMGPLSSMGSPMTLMILPRVSGPTGIMMGLPVSLTTWPLIRPSVPSMAMVLTVFSPRCWATSKMSLG